MRKAFLIAAFGVAVLAAPIAANASTTDWIMQLFGFHTDGCGDGDGICEIVR